MFAGCPGRPVPDAGPPWSEPWPAAGPPTSALDANRRPGPYHERVTGTAKLASTAGLFATALGLLASSVAIHSAIPLFFMWIPLLTVPWVLSRPEGMSRSVTGETGSGDPEDDSK